MTGRQEKVTIIGVGDDGLEGLSESSRRRIEQADLLIGSERTIAAVENVGGEKVVIGTDLAYMVQTIEQSLGKRSIVVLASGDPLFYGVTRYLFERLGKENFEVVPHVSSMQLAFARVMESWEDAYLTNVGNLPLDTAIDRIRVSDKIGLFTNEEYPPPAIAQALLDEGLDCFRCYVCENLGTRNEVVTQGSLAEVAQMSFGPLNVMILIRLPNVPDRPKALQRQLFGNPDEAFIQRRPKQGLLTPAEVRTLALAQLNVTADSTVWDIGAGSGAVSIEAAQLASAGTVYAIEPDQEDCDLIRSNAETFGVKNVEIVCGHAPEVFNSLPAPDCVFIGGTGRQTGGILTEAFERLKPGGRLVVNVASLENVSSATDKLKRLVPHVGLLMINVSRGTRQLENIRFFALNPSFLISAIKPTS